MREINEESCWDDNVANARMKTMGDVVADSVDETDDTLQSVDVSKDFGQKTLRSLKRGLGRLWKRHRGNALITEYDPCYKVAYLGNVLTGWAKGKCAYNDLIAKSMYLSTPPQRKNTLLI